MIAQWILQVLAGTIVGCVIGYFLLRIFTKIRVFLFRKRSNNVVILMIRVKLKIFILKDFIIHLAFTMMI